MKTLLVVLSVFAFCFGVAHVEAALDIFVEDSGDASFNVRDFFNDDDNRNVKEEGLREKRSLETKSDCPSYITDKICQFTQRRRKPAVRKLHSATREELINKAKAILDGGRLRSITENQQRNSAIATGERPISLNLLGLVRSSPRLGVIQRPRSRIDLNLKDVASSAKLAPADACGIDGTQGRRKIGEGDD